MENKITVTGASGFVGKNMLKKLPSIYVVDVLNLRKPPSAFPNESLAIIHLAGKAHDLKNASDPDEYFKVNTDLTIKLFDLFLQSTARDFIYFSSVKAAADTVDGLLTEEVTPTPGTPYGLSKLKAEEYLMEARLPEGKRLFIMRPCMIHGPGNKGNLNLLYKVVSKGIPYPLAGFQNRRSFLSVDNLVYVVERILQDDTIAGGIYNLADDESLSTNDLIRVIAEASGLKPRLWAVSPKLIKLVASVGDKLKLPLNSERLKKLTESYEVSNNKIKRALHIEALPVSARDGLFKTIQSFQE